MIPSPVSRLLLPGCPPNIAGFIMSIVVYSLKSVLGWWVSDILVKCRETISPSLTHRNASTPVMLKGGAGRTLTSFNHRRPNSIDFCLAHPVDSLVFLCPLRLKATATLGVFSSKIRTVCDKFYSTVTPTKPMCLPSPPVGGAAKHSKTTKSLSRHILCGHIVLAIKNLWQKTLDVLPPNVARGYENHYSFIDSIKQSFDGSKINYTTIGVQ